MSDVWSIAGEKAGWPDMGSLEPLCVLMDYDGPRFFVAKSNDRNFFLVYQIGEDQTRERFLLVPATERFIEDIQANRVNLRDALTTSRLVWFVDRFRNGTLSDSHSIDVTDVPDDVLPESGVYLFPSAEPLLRLKLNGEGLGPDQVPGSVVKRAIEAATGAMKVLVRHIQQRKSQTGRPAESLRRLFDLPARDFAFGSFVISFASPEGIDQPQLDEADTLKEVGRLLTEGLKWATEPQGREAPKEEEWGAIVEAIAKLAPPAKGKVKSVEVGGSLVIAPSTAIVLTRTATERVSNARKTTGKERKVRSFEGYIRAFDKTHLTFILRDAKEADIRKVQFGEDEYDDAYLAFETGERVTILVWEYPGSRGAAVAVELDEIIFSASSVDNSVI